MKIRALVTITGIQDSPDTGRNTVEVTIPGEYYFRSGKHYLIYEEVEEGTSNTTRNIVKFCDGQMEVTKRGVVNTHMYFEDGKEFQTTYCTPYGEIPTGFRTSRVTVEENFQFIKAVACYELEMDGSFLADCRLELSAKLFC